VVKWPNDVWVNHKKLSGVLLDSSTMGSRFVRGCDSFSCDYAVTILRWNSVHASLGMGINVNEDISKHPAEEIRGTATSVFNELGYKIER